MPENGGNATSSPPPRDGDSKDGGAKEGGPETPTNTKNGNKNMTQIELTPIESLLFFNMVRFNGNHDKIDWASVAAHSNLKNAASARVRFRQILKKHGLMAQAPETPRSQAQKRKAVVKSAESQDDDEDGDSSYKPNSDVAKQGMRKRSAPRATVSRAKKMKANLGSQHDQDDEEAVANSGVVAPAPAPKIDTKNGIKAEVKTEDEPDSDTQIAPLNGDDMTGAIDGTASASPHKQADGQAPVPQGFSTGAAQVLSLDHHQSALPAYMDDIRGMQLQSGYPGVIPNATHGIGPFGFEQQLSSSQLAALQVHRDPQLQSQGYQLRHLQAPQMLPYPMVRMPGGDLPFGHMAQTQVNEQFPASAYGGVAFFDDQAQLGHDFGYGHADNESFRGRVDGQDEWDLDNGNVKREVTPEE